VSFCNIFVSPFGIIKIVSHVGVAYDSKLNLIFDLIRKLTKSMFIFVFICICLYVHQKQTYTESKPKYTWNF